MTLDLETTDDAIGSVRSHIDNWAAAVRAHDLNGVLRHHADDMVMFDVVGPLRIDGKEAYARTWTESFFPWHGTTGRFELRDLAVEADDRVAFASALIDCAGTENGKAAAFTLRLTIGLVRRGGSWTVIHEHHSEPLPFDTSSIGTGRK